MSPTRCLIGFLMTEDYSAQIKQLEKLINTAATDVSVDGLRSTFDLDHARKRLAELRRLQGDDLRMVRPRVSSITLGGCW